MTVPQFPDPTQPTHPDPIPGVLHYGSLNILAGASGVGKTCLLSWLLTRLRDGKPVFTREVPQPVKVGFIAADRGYLTAGYWFSKVGYRTVPFYSLADDKLFNTSRLRSKTLLPTILGECLDKLELPPGGLACIDPLALFMGGSINDYQTCAVACLEIRRQAQKRQLTLIGTAHAAKQKADKKERYIRLQDRILGSSAQLGYADTQMYLASPEETGERFYSFLWHSHTALPEAFPLGRDRDGLFVPWEQSVESQEEQTIYDMIPPDGSSIAFVTLQGLCSEISRATLFRRLNELIEAGRIERCDHGQYKLAPVN